MFKKVMTTADYISLNTLAKELGYLSSKGLRDHVGKISGAKKVRVGSTTAWMFPNNEQTRKEIAEIGARCSFPSTRGQKRMPAGAAARLRHLEMGEW